MSSEMLAVIRLCEERAAMYGALRRSSLTAIALDRAANLLRQQAEARATSGEGERLREAQADTAFLLARSGNAGKCMFGGKRWTGISSNALVAIAFGEEDAGLPSDSGDLAACYRAVMRLPAHRRTAVVFQHLERGEQHVESKYPGSIDEARKAAEWRGRAALATEGTPS